MPKISDLPIASTLTGAELVPVVQNGVTSRITASALTGATGAAGAGAVGVDIKADFGAIGDGVADDHAAFQAFRTFGQAQGDTHVILTIPEGTYQNGTFDAQWFISGIKRVTVNGYGATVQGAMMIPFAGMYQDNLHSARIATASSGASTVTLVTLADKSKFAVGDYVYIGALDLQGYGYPVNHQFFEYNKITAINSGTGVLTLSALLKNDYLSTYPVYNTGTQFEVDCGGPATIYKLNPNFDTHYEINGLSLDNQAAGAVLCGGRHGVFNHCIFKTQMWPSVAQTLVFNNCDLLNFSEVDKAIDLLVYRNCHISQLYIQSASLNKLVVDGCVFESSLNGTGKNTVVRNCNIPSIGLGPTGYGAMDGVYLENVTAGSISFSGGNTYSISDFTFAGGTLTLPIATHGPPIFIVPGKHLAFNRYYGPPFKVLNMRQSGSNILIDTDLPDPMVNAESNPATPSVTFGLPKDYAAVRAVNCTGCQDLVQLSNVSGYPYGNYIKQIYAGHIAYPYQSTAVEGIRGRLVSAKVNVIRAYTGSGALNWRSHPGGGADANRIDTGAYFGFKIEVNAKTAGLRVITPSGNTGAQAGDTLPTIPADIWIVNGGFPGVTADISAATLLQTPIISYEITTDLGDGTMRNWTYDARFVN